MRKVGWDLRVLGVIREERVTTFKDLLRHPKLKKLTKSTLSKVLDNLERAGLINVIRDKRTKIKGKGKPLLICDKDFEPLEIYVLNSIIRIINRELILVMEEPLPSHLAINYGISSRKLEELIVKHEKEILIDTAISYGEDPRNEEFKKRFYKALSTVLKKIRKTKEYEKEENLYPVLIRLLNSYRIWYGAFYQRSNAPDGI